MAYIVSGTLSALLGVSAHIGVFPSLLMYDQYRIKAFSKIQLYWDRFGTGRFDALDDMREKAHTVSCMGTYHSHYYKFAGNYSFIFKGSMVKSGGLYIVILRIKHTEN